MDLWSWIHIQKESHEIQSYLVSQVSGWTECDHGWKQSKLTDHLKCGLIWVCKGLKAIQVVQCQECSSTPGLLCQCGLMASISSRDVANQWWFIVNVAVKCTTARSFILEEMRQPCAGVLWYPPSSSSWWDSIGCNNHLPQLNEAQRLWICPVN